MKPSEHETRYSELVASMPTEELARELVAITIEHDASLEAVNHFAEFFGRVAVEQCAADVATASADINQGELFRADI
jgi:hypothetical protein